MSHLSPSCLRWALNTRADPAWRHWGGETVAHHRLGNDTHRLAEPAGWILDRLAGDLALTTEEIAFDAPYEAADLEPPLQVLVRLGFLARC